MAGLSYPLGRDGRGEATSAAGTPVADITLERVVAGEIAEDDVRVSADTLRLQAGFAEVGGNRQLAENLRRGAELTAFADDEVLRFYDLLRPGRATAAELDDLARTLEGRGAALTAALVREARAAYVRRGLAG